MADYAETKYKILIAKESRPCPPDHIWPHSILHAYRLDCLSWSKCLCWWDWFTELGASSVITPVRMIIFILALTAIGWFASRIDTASNSDPATTTMSETMPAPTESVPAIPLARPKFDGDDTATVVAASATPTGGTPPKPLAKPELYDVEAMTVPAAETTPTSSQER